MSGRHQPEHGADSACPICQGTGRPFQRVHQHMLADRQAYVELVLDPMAEAIAEGLTDEFRNWGFDVRVEMNETACPMCQGQGSMMGGDEYQTCPKCKGAGTVPCAGFHGDNAWGPCQSCGERLEAHQMIAP